MTSSSYQSVLWEQFCNSQLTYSENRALNNILVLPHPQREIEFVKWSQYAVHRIHTTATEPYDALLQPSSTNLHRLS
jgi:hypothetical protein